VKQIEDTFKDFTTREDIAIVLIVQFVRPALVAPPCYVDPQQTFADR